MTRRRNFVFRVVSEWPASRSAFSSSWIRLNPRGNKPSKCKSLSSGYEKCHRFTPVLSSKETRTSQNRTEKTHETSRTDCTGGDAQTGGAPTAGRHLAVFRSISQSMRALCGDILQEKLPVLHAHLWHLHFQKALKDSSALSTSQSTPPSVRQSSSRAPIAALPPRPLESVQRSSAGSTIPCCDPLWCTEKTAPAPPERRRRSVYRLYALQSQGPHEPLSDVIIRSAERTVQNTSEKATSAVAYLEVTGADNHSETRRDSERFERFADWRSLTEAISRLIHVAQRFPS
ncbi:hypothetical protein N1851_016587 [Merluccius polli]|uniref:Uncharacterized protein n=1 Tax=Merluccius polli TaxID=89951 RepID=A0AA47P2U8_MERPO|nr:hypothetical protein N1851_016587 [Merluccius polli]